MNFLKDGLLILKIKSESLYSLTGFGDGSHIKDFFENTSSGTHFLVVEKDPALLRKPYLNLTFLIYFPMTDYFWVLANATTEFFKDLQAAAMLGWQMLIV